MTRESGNNLAIVGGQWGDEGKGKIVDICSRDFDIVARYQGGHNAGHTIRIGSEKYVLHLIPSGIFQPKIECVIGSGVVLDPKALIDEIASLESGGFTIDDRLHVSTRCQLIFPYHREVEAAIEHHLGDDKIGTTSRGIGPAYEDKAARRGLRVGDLLVPDDLRERIRTQVDLKNRTLQALGADGRIDAEEVADQYIEYAKVLAPHLMDTTMLLNKAIRDGKRVLFEGAQATLLDIDHGTYPFVTSSNATVCGIPAGLGIAPRHVHEVLGIIKAYTTRVGAGPFPTEAEGPTAEQLQSRGVEFGSTTGRPRRCGWLDGVAIRYAAMINAMDGLAVTKLDVLDDFDEIPFCIGYRYRGGVLDDFPADARVLAEVKPIYKNLPGWKTSTEGITEWSDLPVAARDYLTFIADFTGTPIRMVSTGAERDQTVRV